MIILGIFLITLQILDIVSTHIGIKIGCEEGNPLLKKSFKMGIPVIYIILKIALSIFLTCLLFFGSIILNWILVGLNLFTLVVVLSNTLNIHLQKKWNKEFEEQCVIRKNITQYAKVCE